MEKRHVIPGLTGMRAIAATMIFFYHWFFDNARILPLIFRAPFDVGYVAVPMFFALSGFLITERYYEDFIHRRVSISQYLRKRFIRIYPLYFVVLTFFVMMLNRPEGIVPKGFHAIAATYTLTQALFPEFLLIGTTVGWTLTLQGIFYLIAPWLSMWLGQSKSMYRIALRALLVGVLSIFLGILIADLPRSQWSAGTFLGAPQTYLMHYSIFGHLPDFLAGMVAGLIYVKWSTGRTRRYARTMIWAGMIGMFACIVALDTIVMPLGSLLKRVLGIGAALATAIIILGMTYDDLQSSLVSKILSSRPAVYLGKISYALFLIQLTEPCQWIYWVLLGANAGIENRILRAVLLYGITLIIAAILYELIERPAHKWLNRGFTRQKQDTETT